MRTLVQTAKMFEGELYPTASSVIPFLDTVFDDLKTLSGKVRGAAKTYVDLLLSNLQSSRRFHGGYKTLAPYNCLTLLDLRCVVNVLNALQNKHPETDCNNDYFVDNDDNTKLNCFILGMLTSTLMWQSMRRLSMI